MTGQSPPPWLTENVTTITDFPTPGVQFRDLGPLWRSPAATSRCAVALAHGLEDVDVVVGIESRGFLAGLITAQRLGVGFVPVRKQGKLPGEVLSVSYDLEYGTDVVELQAHAIDADDRVVIVDDVIATGGTAAATAELVAKAGGEVVEIRSVIELLALGGRSRIAPHPVLSLWEIDD